MSEIKKEGNRTPSRKKGFMRRSKSVPGPTVGTLRGQEKPQKEGKQIPVLGYPSAGVSPGEEKKEAGKKQTCLTGEKTNKKKLPEDTCRGPLSPGSK